MKAIMVMFDSLNRHMLEPYGCKWVQTPNFDRLAQKAVTFDNCYVGSMPCMPARRELHTGRYNFLHRSWGPLEPFDDSMPQILRENNIHSHLISDHYHYWEDGGATYHNRYASWEICRGQEGDLWKAHVGRDFSPGNLAGQHVNAQVYRIRQDLLNRLHSKDEAHPQRMTFQLALEFLDTNWQADDWFLQIETFDPHEPWFCDQKYKDIYTAVYDGPEMEWPVYGPVSEEAALVENGRKNNAALVTMCDASLGRVLDFMDAHQMWDDTMLIVNTDHGFLLGEHDYWAKSLMPFYQEIAHTPLFIWDPRAGVANERRNSLVQTIDLPATLLDYFQISLPKDMEGKPLGAVIVEDQPVREAALFGMFSAHVNITDGQYVYMRAPADENAPLFQYTHMPTHMRSMFDLDELRNMTLGNPFPFTKDCPVMKIPTQVKKGRYETHTQLYNVQEDPEQKAPLDAPEIEERMVALLQDAMRANHAPQELFERLGLNA